MRNIRPDSAQGNVRIAGYRSLSTPSCKCKRTNRLTVTFSRDDSASVGSRNRLLARRADALAFVTALPAMVTAAVRQPAPCQGLRVTP